MNKNLKIKGIIKHTYNEIGMKYNWILLFSCLVTPVPTIKKYLGPRSLKQQQQKQIDISVQQYKISQDNDPLYKLHQMIYNIKISKYFIIQAFL